MRPGNILPMTTIEPSLARQVEDNPDEVYRVIVRVDGDLDVRRIELQELGFTIDRQLRLVRGFGSTAPGTCIIHASEQAWIISIEPDTEMRAL